MTMSLPCAPALTRYDDARLGFRTRRRCSKRQAKVRKMRRAQVLQPSALLKLEFLAQGGINQQNASDEPTLGATERDGGARNLGACRYLNCVLGSAFRRGFARQVRLHEAQGEAVALADGLIFVVILGA